MNWTNVFFLALLIVVTGVIIGIILPPEIGTLFGFFNGFIWFLISEKYFPID